MEREHYVGETDQYRELRDELLQQEIALSDQTERVAESRRRLPTNPVATDYVFREGPADLGDDSHGAIQERLLSDLFDEGKSILIVQHVMYHPDDDEACPMCSMWADGFNGIAHHVRQRASFVLTAKADINKFRVWGRRRGWTNIRLLSSHGTTFQPDFGFEDAEGNQSPGLSVFVRTDSGEIRHAYSVHARMTGEHERGIDPLSPVWNLLDLLPDGRGDWEPSTFYAPSSS